MGTGGSRYGAGRPGWRRKCEELPRVDVRYLRRRRLLWPWTGSRFPLRWSRGDEPAGSVSVESTRDGLRLLYQWTPWDGDPVSMDYHVWIERTECYFGGHRSWFRCPRCSLRCAVLYGVASDGKFGCRSCMRLGYSSEAESVVDRINRKSHKLEAKLGEDGEKPKWMRWRTFDRICQQLEAADQAWGAQVLTRLAPL